MMTYFDDNSDAQLAFNYKDVFPIIADLRKDPILATKLLFNIDLYWTQRIMLETSWFMPFVLNIASKGQGKSMVGALLALLTAILYPQEKIGLISKTLRQIDKTVIREISYLIDKSPIVKDCITEFRRSDKEGFKCVFSNGSFIQSLPPTASIQGNRFNRIILDEYHLIPEKIISSVIKDTLAVSKDVIVKSNSDRRNSLTIITNAYWKWNHLYKLYEYYKKMINSGVDGYVINQFDYLCMPEKYYDKNVLEEQRANITEEEWKMNWLSVFPDNTRGWIPSNIWEECVSRYEDDESIQAIKLEEGRKGKKYVMSVDVARSEVGDNTVIQLWELNKRKAVSSKDKPQVFSLVKSVSLSGAEYTEQAIVIWDLLEKFDVLRIAMDRAKGDCIMDILVSGVDKYGGSRQKILPIREKDKDGYELSDKHDGVDGIRLIRLVDFTEQYIHTMGDRTSKFMRNNHVSLPEYESLEDEIRLVKNEVIMIEAEVTSKGLLRFKLPTELEKENKKSAFISEKKSKGKKIFKKDRWTAFMLGINECAIVSKLVNDEEENKVSESEITEDFIKYFSWSKTKVFKKNV